MSPIHIRNNNSNNYTLISNFFLDHYMAEANGEFVKIYLYLLRTMSDAPSSLTLLAIADTLNCTERDVERALKYWSRKQVLKLEYDEKNSLTGIIFLPFEDALLESAPTTEKKPLAAPVTEPVQASRNRLSASRIQELKANEEIVSLLFIAEQYIGKTLSQADTTRILYFYEELNFSVDLIEYLIEYCVSNSKNSTRYMEKVALAWHESGITTTAMAKQHTNTYNKNYFSILKSLGVSNRNPVAKEVQIMDRWLNDYGFTLDIITEACARTIAQTGKPSFAYADGIVQAWHENGVRSLKDVETLDQQHKQGKAEKPAPPRSNKTTNKFNNFPQREYDFTDLEKQLLNK